MAQMTDSSSFSLIRESEPRRIVPETTQRIVSFLDIMGFKDMIARQEETKIKDKLETLSRFISENVTEESGMQFSIFSDSIIIFTKDKESESFQQIVELSGKIVRRSISLGLPIKGAIASGLCTVSQGVKPFYFGQPIVDAYLLEENIVLYGVAMHHTVEELAEQLFLRTSRNVFDYALPLKKGTSRHYVLDWFSEDKVENLNKLNQIRRTVSDSPRRYIDNTIACIKYREA